MVDGKGTFKQRRYAVSSYRDAGPANTIPSIPSFYPRRALEHLVFLPVYWLLLHDAAVRAGIVNDCILCDDVVIGLKAEPYACAGEIECEIEGRQYVDTVVLGED